MNRLFDLSDDSFALFMGLLWVGLFCLIYGIVAGVQHVAFGAELARWESLRAEVAVLRCDVTDVRQATLAVEVAKENADLAKAKYYNRQWWADLTIPDEIENVQPIAVCGGAV